MKNPDDQILCPIARAASLVGDEKIMLALRELLKGPKRFDDLQKNTQVATNILSNRLARMMEAGIVEKEQYQDRPARFNYKLTGAGYSLFPVVLAMWRFAEDWMPCSESPPSMLRHGTCGKLTRPGAVCTECGGELSIKNVKMETVKSETAAS